MTDFLLHLRLPTQTFQVIKVPTNLDPISNTSNTPAFGVISALLLGLNLLVFGTFTVFSQNSGEFLVPYTDVLLGYYLPVLAVFALIGLLPALLGGSTGRAINAVIILLATMTYIHGNLLLWNTGILDGIELDLTKTWRSYVDAVLWLMFAWLAYRHRNWLAIHGWKLSLMLILFQTIGVLAVLKNNPESMSPELSIFPEELTNLSSKINVFQIILDGFQGSIFEKLLTTHPELADELDGFTYFRDTTTSSDVTYLSVPASLSGKAFRNKQPISTYRKSTLRGENLYSFLAEKGFGVDVASPVRWNDKNPIFSSYYRIPKPYSSSQETLWSTALFLMDVSLYRQLPHFLKPLVYRSGTWLLSDSLVERPEQQFEHFADNTFLTDLSSRMAVATSQPKYKFIHLVTPHAPFVSAADCKFTGTPLDYSESAFTQQSICTLKNTIALLIQLKRIGVYDNSMLVIYGDHGGGVGFPMTGKNGEKTTSSKALHRMWGNPLPLLLIKPPAAKGKIRISDKQVQLLDIPATIIRQLGFAPSLPGNPVFEDNPDLPIERFFSTSKIHRTEAAKKDYFEEFTTYRISGSIYQLDSWQEIETQVDPATDEAGLYRWDAVISFGSRGNFHALQDGGWVVTKARDASWTQGKRARLAINFPETTGPVAMQVNVKPKLVPGILERQRVNIFIGQHKAGEWSVSTGGFQDLELIIPKKLFNRTGKTEITFQLPDARSPQSLGVGREKRAIALAFLSIRFKPVPQSSTK